MCSYALRQRWPIRVSEAGYLSDEDQVWLRANEIPFEQGGHREAFLLGVQDIVLSPGIPSRLPVLEKARQQGVRVLSETEFAWQRAPSGPVIAVTGTNGKSSTVEAIAALARGAGRTAWPAGNIGCPLISLIDTVLPGDVIVIEMSSYQLEQTVAFRPNVGVLLNLAPDHLARHGSMQAYADAKGRLFENQTETDVAVLPRCLAERFTQGLGRRVYHDEQFPDLPVGATKLRAHEQANLRAALCAWEAVSPTQSISDVDLDALLPAFRLPHRMSTVGWVNDVLVINDSKATNPAATVAAISSLSGRLVLLLGGRFKEGGYEALASAVDAGHVRQIVLFGEASGQLEAELSVGKKVVPRLVAASLEDAVHVALRIAEPGDTLLLSPACSSFDGFRDFADRGERFVDVIRRYPGYRSA